MSILRKIWESIVKYVKKLANFIVNNIRKVAMVIGKFFTLLTQWIDKALKYVEATFNVVVNGVQTFLKKVGDEYQELSYNYTRQSDGNYTRNTVVRQSFVSEDEIPADIKALALQMEDGDLKDISNVTAEKQEYACQELQLT